MKLSLQKPLNKRNVIRAACAPLLLALFLPGSGVAAERNAGLSLNMGATSTASRWVNVTGTVKDSKGEPLPGVTVKIKGTNTGTSTDVNGVFRLNLPTGNETLVFSFVGFNSIEVPAAGRTSFNVVMQESVNAMDEIIVTGYGEKKRSEIVGSVATITGQEIQDIPAPNIAGALRNRIAGVGVSQVSGRPGARITLNVRNSTNSEQAALYGSTAEPLYIIDGITVTSEVFENLDASMVENISILKDASAAIYGASGAKGVVLVTTKRGKQGKPSISYNGYYGVNDAAKEPEFLSAVELATLLNDGYKMLGTTTGGTRASDFFTDADLETIKNLNYKSWYDQLWSASTMQRHNLNISGGSDKITFFVGGSFQNEDGNYEGLKQNRFGFRSGMTAKITEGLSADLNFNVDQRLMNSKNPSSDADQNFFETIISMPQWIPLEINGLPVNINNGSPRNPLGVLRSGYYNNTKSQGYRINASINYQPKFLKGLSAKFQFSQGGSKENNRIYQPPYKLYDFVRTGNNLALYSNTLLPGVTSANVPNYEFAAITPLNASITPRLTERNSYQGFLTLSYNRTFKAHTISALVGGEQTEGNSEALGVRWTNQIIPERDDWWAFDPTKLVIESNTIGQETKRSFFGRFSYDFDKKYLVEGVMRLDASSNFAKGNRWGASPSIGLGWVVSQEDFFKDNVPFINFLKFKANYGITGDDRIVARLWQERYTIDTSNGYLYGDNTNTNGLNPAIFPNVFITWEKKETMNLGMEMSLLNNKIDLGIEVFRNRSYDVFDRGNERMYPLYSGFQGPVVNYRESYNWGSEFNIGYKANLTKDLKLNTSMNFGYGNSVVERIIYPAGDLLELNLNSGNYLGNKFGTDPRKYNSSNIGLRSRGMFRTQAEVDAFMAENPNYKIYAATPQPGWLNYEDVNGDGIINDYDMVPLFDNTNSFFSTGLSIGLSYKDFALSTNIFARLGGKVFFDSRARTAPSLTRNVIPIWTDRWTPENPQEGKFPRFDDPSISRNSDFWAVDGTTIRVNNMTLSYKVPAKYASKLGLSNAKLLATGNNLWTLVNPFPYKDPYTSSAYDYPTIRTISFGLSLSL
jgi:TonB-linked SusC/RagA family outer membrane protein